MPSVMTIEGAERKRCRYRLTRVFRGEREVKGCFRTKADALDFADMLNPIPCRRQCWKPMHARPPGVPMTVFRGRLGQPNWNKPGRRKARARHLGASATDHRYIAKSYEQEFARSLHNAQQATDRGSCRDALEQVIDAAQMRQGYGAHAFAFKQGRAGRQKTSDRMIKRMKAVTRRFADRCVL